MQSVAYSPQFCSLTEWSQRHIHDIFEASTDEQALAAIAATFTPDVNATINGTPITREHIKQLVLSLRKGSKRGLKVHWQTAVEHPEDPFTNREGSFSGSYIIRGIYKILPGHSTPVEFERRKTVQVRIEAQSPELSIDSRQIVHLAFVASDVRVGRQATL
ncbi:hypothetical protein BDQ17DRAFT_1358473 [Cyathus striatus]|nr:hypothetical protein BDQ17DRAFT_1358473 [Cyathus striatus]